LKSRRKPKVYQDFVNKTPFHRGYWTERIDLREMILDGSLLPQTKRVRCKFKGCISILNQVNAKRQIFCENHERKITLLLSIQKDHFDYKYYKKLVERFLVKLAKIWEKEKAKV